MKKKITYIGLSVSLLVGCSEVYYNSYGNPRTKSENWSYRDSDFLYSISSGLDTTHWYIGAEHTISVGEEARLEQYCYAWAFSSRGLFVFNSLKCDSVSMLMELTPENSVDRASAIGRYRFKESMIIDAEYFTVIGGGTYKKKKNIRLSGDTLFVPITNFWGSEVDSYYLVKSNIPIEW